MEVTNINTENKQFSLESKYKYLKERLFNEIGVFCTCIFFICLAINAGYLAVNYKQFEINDDEDILIFHYSVFLPINPAFAIVKCVSAAITGIILPTFMIQWIDVKHIISLCLIFKLPMLWVSTLGTEINYFTFIFHGAVDSLIWISAMFYIVKQAKCFAKILGLTEEAALPAIFGLYFTAVNLSKAPVAVGLPYIFGIDGIHVYRYNNGMPYPNCTMGSVPSGPYNVTITLCSTLLIILAFLLFIMKHKKFKCGNAKLNLLCNPVQDLTNIRLILLIPVTLSVGYSQTLYWSLFSIRNCSSIYHTEQFIWIQFAQFILEAVFCLVTGFATKKCGRFALVLLALFADILFHILYIMQLYEYQGWFIFMRPLLVGLSTGTWMNQIPAMYATNTKQYTQTTMAFLYIWMMIGSLLINILLTVMIDELTQLIVHQVLILFTIISFSVYEFKTNLIFRFRKFNINSKENTEHPLCDESIENTEHPLCDESIENVEHPYNSKEQTEDAAADSSTEN